jgi:plastocyanin
MKSRTPLLASALGLAVLAGSLSLGQNANAQAGFGTIKGRVVWGKDELPTPMLKVKKGNANEKDAAVCAVADIFDETYVVDPKSKGVADAFAYVFTPKGKNPEVEAALLSKSPTVVMDQKNCRFLPHCVAVFMGQEMIFKSSDPVGHNVHCSGFNINLNQMVPVGGQLKETFTKIDTGPVKITCDLHPWMNGALMVFDHPFFAITKPDGSFEIKGVPAGPQQLIVRHAESGFITTGLRRGQTITVPDGGVVEVGELKLIPK